MDFAFSEEENDFRAMVRDWVEEKCPKEHALELERHEDHDGTHFPHQLWQDMADAGFLGIGIDEELGGQGGGAIVQSIFMEEIARSLAGISWVWGINQFNAKSIQRFATDELASRADAADRRRRDARPRSRSPSRAPAPTCSAG